MQNPDVWRRSYAKHRDKILAKAKANRAANREIFLERERQFRIRHRETLIARKAERRQDPEERRKQSEYFKNNPHVGFKSRIKCKYGMTIGQYNAMVESQGGLCAICRGENVHPTRWGNHSFRLVVDHCHATGKVRGLLCHKCNSAIGQFGENPNFMVSAMAYLSQHR